MKRLVMIALATALFAAPAMSQKTEKEQQEWENKVKTELQLTAEQTVQYDAIASEFKGKIEDLKADNSLSNDAKEQRKLELKKEKESRINQILSPDQQVKFTSLMDKKKTKMKKEKPSRD